MLDATNYLLYGKKSEEIDPYILEEFSPWFTSKVLSFYGAGIWCQFVNDNLNMYSGLFKTKEEEFKFFENIIPKLKKRNWEYIKKEKKEKVKEEAEHIPEFLSKREVDMMKSLSK